MSNQSVDTNNNIDTSVSQWLKQIIDERLNYLINNPDCIEPIEKLFNELD